MLAEQFAFATLAQLKERLSIDDALQDDLLQELLVQTAAAIEQEAGRRLRRRHQVTEYFRGGGDVIRTSSTHLAKIHSIRESAVRDFEDPELYDELVENVDYVLEATDQGEPEGASGIIRRLGTSWKGTPQSPKQVQVVYTGGFKTAGEEALENRTAVLANVGELEDFALFLGDNYTTSRAKTDPTIDVGVIEPDGGFGAQRMILVVRPDNALLPVWTIARILVTVHVAFAAGPQESLRLDAKLLGIDPRDRINPIEVFEAAAANVLAWIGTYWEIMGGVNEAFTFGEGMHVGLADATIAGINRCLKLYGCFGINFSIEGDTSFPQAKALQIGTIDHGTASMKPVVSIQHQTAFLDSFAVPADLVRANLMQAVHEYKSMTSPGVIQESTRGVAIASGMSRMLNQSDLLAPVKSIAQAYRRVY